MKEFRKVTLTAEDPLGQRGCVTVEIGAAAGSSNSASGAAGCAGSAGNLNAGGGHNWGLSGLPEFAELDQQYNCFLRAMLDYDAFRFPKVHVVRDDSQRESLLTKLRAIELTKQGSSMASRIEHAMWQRMMDALTQEPEAKPACDGILAVNQGDRRG